jgi:hypothetical protein
MILFRHDIVKCNAYAMCTIDAALILKDTVGKCLDLEISDYLLSQGIYLFQEGVLSLSSSN